MTFSLTVLGSSAAIPANNRNLSAHLINSDERLFLIDCGEGTQFQLKRYRKSFRRIRYILISHLHGDHFFGLIGLLNTMHLLGRTEELDLFAPADLETIITMQLQASSTRLSYPVRFHPLDMDQYMPLLETNRIRVHSFPLKHSIPACGFIFREHNPPRNVKIPRSYAYCSDTMYDERIIQWISGVGVLYHEATFMQDKAQAAIEKFHSTGVDAANVAVKARAGKLLLGHFSARYEDVGPLIEEACKVFPETVAVEEGLRVDL